MHFHPIIAIAIGYITSAFATASISEFLGRLKPMQAAIAGIAILFALSSLLAATIYFLA